MRIEREKKRAFIGLGTNMGDKQLQLETALEKLKDRGIRLLQTSTRIETEPWGGVEQDTFLNQVAEVETWMTPEDLLETLLAIEQEMDVFVRSSGATCDRSRSALHGGHHLLQSELDLTASLCGRTCLCPRIFE